MVGRKSGGKERSCNGRSENDLLEDAPFDNLRRDVVEDGVKRPLGWVDRWNGTDGKKAIAAGGQAAPGENIESCP